jgi:hypothetical protein
MTAGFDSDDDRSQLPADQQESEAESAVELATLSMPGAAVVPAIAKQERQFARRNGAYRYAIPFQI